MDSRDKEILLQAKKIMNDFSQAMEHLDITDVSYDLERKKCMRDEKEGLEADEEFVSLFLNNAPQIKGSSIVANKGSWVEK